VRLLLYENLPLRTSGALGNFAEEFVLAHRYGDLGRFALNRLDDKTFFAADHPMTLGEVFVDNQTTSAWQQKTQTDGNGNTWTVAELAAPAPDGAEISATGTGKRNPRTGALIENPADIIEDFLRLANRSDVWWDQLRAEAAAEGLRLAGSVDEVASIREWIDRVCRSAGAIWTPGMARLYPVPAVSGFVVTLDKMKVSNLVVTANLDNTADVLRLYYDPDKAGGKNQHYIELTANPTRYGGLPTDLTFEWLRTPANAESVGKRVLPWLAGERYDVAFDCGDYTVRPGQWVRITGHPQWPFVGADPVVMVLSAVIKPKSRTISCTGQALVSSPTADVTAHSIGLPATRDASVEVGVKDGIATFVVRDSQGAPVLGARVNVDGGQALKTDANGAVRFPATPGEHKIAIQAPGKRAEIATMLL
jgi:hypothetical protein